MSLGALATWRWGNWGFSFQSDHNPDYSHKKDKSFSRVSCIGVWGSCLHLSPLFPPSFLRSLLHSLSLFIFHCTPRRIPAPKSWKLITMLERCGILAGKVTWHSRKSRELIIRSPRFKARFPSCLAPILPLPTFNQQSDLRQRRWVSISRRSFLLLTFHMEIQKD